jgi:hypothetical protein
MGYKVQEAYDMVCRIEGIEVNAPVPQSFPRSIRFFELKAVASAVRDEMVWQLTDINFQKQRDSS